MPHYFGAVMPPQFGDYFAINKLHLRFLGGGIIILVVFLLIMPLRIDWNSPSNIQPDPPVIYVQDHVTSNGTQCVIATLNSNIQMVCNWNESATK